jgi:hypothetical protein
MKLEQFVSGDRRRFQLGSADVLNHKSSLNWGEVMFASAHLFAGIDY